MAIPASPTVPDPTSSTFADDAYPFTQWMAELPAAIDAETARLNSLGFGAYSATSTTSLTVGTGSQSLTVETGKGFTVGQPVMVTKTTDATTYMVGQVTSYDSGTGALVVNATATQGSGTNAAWTVSVASVVAGGGVSPDSIVTLTSGTSWTCPAGVTKVRLRMVGGGGGTGRVNASVVSYPGAAGGYAEKLFSATPGNAYTYSIGAGGAAAYTDSTYGGTGGNTTFNTGSVTVSAYGGSGGLAGYLTVAPGGGASNGDINIHGSAGVLPYQTINSSGGDSALGCGGSYGGNAPGYGGGGGGFQSGGAQAGGAGVIILELYK